jgi:hypothetical protein
LKQAGTKKKQVWRPKDRPEGSGRSAPACMVYFLGTRSSEFGLVTAAGSHSIAPFAGIRQSSFPPRQNTPSHMDVLAHGLLSEKSSSRRSFVFGAIAPCSGGDAALFWRGAGATTTEASRRSSTSRGTLPLIRSICGVLCRHGSFSLLIFFVVLI